MPFDKALYPGWWKQFSLYIRKERAGDRCENFKCGIENGVHNPRGSLVVLTVAHLDYDGGVCDCKELTGRKCARPDHVLALCQACHLRMDMPRHIANRRESLKRQKDAARGLFANQDDEFFYAGNV